jgi:hypothetical protein
MNGIAAMRFWHLSRPTGLSEDLAKHDLAAEICPQEEFHTILEREKARADRNGHGFSLVTLEVSGLGDVFCLTEYLRHRIRTTDEIGWFNGNTLGVFLYNTSALGAGQFVNKSRQERGVDFSLCKATVYCYPIEWCSL